jgi:predicted MPP superfamily phosphohydrolase
MKKVICCFIVLTAIVSKVGAQPKKVSSTIEIVFTSDAHYGITRKDFRGKTEVDGHTVNAALVKEINTVPNVKLPLDSGINAGNTVGSVDYIIEGGDIANRMEVPIQTAATSWAQFDTDYVKSITLKGHDGKPAKLLMVPGNHDISNAIGYYKPMTLPTDATPMANIYNLMVKPATPVTNATYRYDKDKINYSRNIGGIHFMFITLWPDSVERTWMEKDLQKISPKTPVIIFTHDQPDCEPKHFTNPNPGHTVNAKDKFENLVTEQYKDGAATKEEGNKTDIEQRGWVAFLKKHPNIKAYFHGNSNFSEFYVYKGPDNDIALNVFRADSPMKGKYSSKDETKLSFMVISIDPNALTLTARECLWNTDPTHPETPVKWGASKTVSLK